MSKDKTGGKSVPHVVVTEREVLLAQMADLRSQVAALATRNAELEAQVAELSTAAAPAVLVNDRVAELEAENARLRAELAASRSSEAAAKTDAVITASQLLTANAEVARLTAAIDLPRSELAKALDGKLAAHTSLEDHKDALSEREAEGEKTLADTTTVAENVADHAVVLETALDVSSDEVAGLRVELATAKASFLDMRAKLLHQGFAVHDEESVATLMISRVEELEVELAEMTASRDMFERGSQQLLVNALAVVMSLQAENKKLTSLLTNKEAEAEELQSATSRVARRLFESEAKYGGAVDTAWRQADAAWSSKSEQQLAQIRHLEGRLVGSVETVGKLTAVNQALFAQVKTLRGELAETRSAATDLARFGLMAAHGAEVGDTKATVFAAELERRAAEIARLKAQLTAKEGVEAQLATVTAQLAVATPALDMAKELNANRAARLALEDPRTEAYDDMQRRTAATGMKAVREAAAAPAL